MAQLNDPERLQSYLNALKDWRISGSVVVEALAWTWLRTHLPTVRSQREICRLLCEHVERGGEIDEQVEKREHWKDYYPYHYDLRVSIGGRQIYFETVLEYPKHQDPYVRVVNAHE